MAEGKGRTPHYLIRRIGCVWLFIAMLMFTSACSGSVKRGAIQPPPGVDLLPVPPLGSGISGWQLWLQPGSRIAGVNQARMVEDETYGRVAEFSRSAEETGDGGAAGIFLPLEINTRSYPHIYLWLVGRVLHEECGNLANHNPRWFPEGALQVRVSYLTNNGEDVDWYYGFYYSEVDGVDTDHFARVKPEKWFSYLSPDLMNLKPKPYQITEVRLYGFCWRFWGQAADIRLIGTTQKVD